MIIPPRGQKFSKRQPENLKTSEEPDLRGSAMYRDESTCIFETTQVLAI